MTARQHVVSAARGDQPMDLVVRNVDLVNVFTAELYKADLGIKGDRYAAVARYEDGAPAFDLQGFKEIDGTGKVAMPGFVDSHVHIESMMVPPDTLSPHVPPASRGASNCASEVIRLPPDTIWNGMTSAWRVASQSRLISARSIGMRPSGSSRSMMAPLSTTIRPSTMLGIPSGPMSARMRADSGRSGSY